MPKHNPDTPEPSSTEQAREPGWYPEPQVLRYWNGDAWTDRVDPKDKVVLSPKELDKQIGNVGFFTMCVFMFTALLASIPAVIMAGIVVLFGLSLLGGAVG